ncbi:hypothetical protein ACQP1G_22995 [Nocardia sp. CA-107356]|uniref:hypothetical protein n=1 Tax=Nocardia sp. CA-107356 TaxID=3239972 RepID=UPI003D8CA650
MNPALAMVTVAVSGFVGYWCAWRKRPGTPTPYDSSVGGPMLWPASEPWPSCPGPHDQAGWSPYSNSPEELMSPADARLERWIHAGRYDRALTPQEREILDGLDRTVRLPKGPIAMLPVAQLFVRDVPGLRPPAGADLLQVLWCPLDHDSDPRP